MIGLENKFDLFKVEKNTKKSFIKILQSNFHILAIFIFLIIFAIVITLFFKIKQKNRYISLFECTTRIENERKKAETEDKEKIEFGMSTDIKVVLPEQQINNSNKITEVIVENIKLIPKNAISKDEETLQLFFLEKKDKNILEKKVEDDSKRFVYVKNENEKAFNILLRVKKKKIVSKEVNKDDSIMNSFKTIKDEKDLDLDLFKFSISMNIKVKLDNGQIYSCYLNKKINNKIDLENDVFEEKIKTDDFIFIKK